MITRESVFNASGQFYIQDGGTLPPVSSWDFSNGLVLTASVGATILTGEAYGDIHVALHIWDVRPPLADDPYGLTDRQEWDDIVEASILCEEGNLAVVSSSTAAVHLPKLDTCGPGTYRVRVHVRGRDTPHIDPDGFPHPTDEFLIVSWPEPMHPTLPIRLADRKGASVRLSNHDDIIRLSQQSDSPHEICPEVTRHPVQPTQGPADEHDGVIRISLYSHDATAQDLPDTNPDD
jgi:hypothetical protein